MECHKFVICLLSFETVVIPLIHNLSYLSRLLHVGVLQLSENEQIDKDASADCDSKPSSSSSSAEPARKRSRLLGSMDPNSKDVQQLLKARSSHTGALAQVIVTMASIKLVQ